MSNIYIIICVFIRLRYEGVNECEVEQIEKRKEWDDSRKEGRKEYDNALRPNASHG